MNSFYASNSTTHKGSPNGKKKDPVEQCRVGLLDKLTKLKESQILNNSLTPLDKESAFELLEFYGDSLLYHRITQFLMQTRRFMSPRCLTEIRASIINNKNLSKTYDSLNLKTLIPEADSQSANHFCNTTVNTSQPNYKRRSNPDLQITKSKADAVEAILGELAEQAANNPLQTARINSVLDELLAYICYSGEQHYFSQKEQPTPINPPNGSNINNSANSKKRSKKKLSFKSKKALSSNEEDEEDEDSDGLYMPFAPDEVNELTSKEELHVNSDDKNNTVVYSSSAPTTSYEYRPNGVPLPLVQPIKFKPESPPRSVPDFLAVPPQQVQQQQTPQQRHFSSLDEMIKSVAQFQQHENTNTFSSLSLLSSTPPEKLQQNGSPPKTIFTLTNSNANGNNTSTVTNIFPGASSALSSHTAPISSLSTPNMLATPVKEQLRPSATITTQLLCSQQGLYGGREVQNFRVLKN
jgi:hypothetical protein